MTISELIATLEVLKTEHGDLPVLVVYDGEEFERVDVMVLSEQKPLNRHPPKRVPKRVVIY